MSGTNVNQSNAKIAPIEIIESEFATRLKRFELIADSGEWGTYSWSQIVLGTPGGRIAGGSDEVMRNIVGERVLGLPRP